MIVIDQQLLYQYANQWVAVYYYTTKIRANAITIE